MTFNPKNLCLERVGKSPYYRSLNFKKPISVLGRHESCDLVAGGRTVSRKHCELSFENGKLYVKNISTSTCTYLNEDKILGKTEVELGDLIGLGTRTANDDCDEELYVYKCIEIPYVNLVSDDEAEVTSKASIESITSIQRPVNLDSPGFSSDTSTATVRNRRDYIQNITNNLSDIRENNIRKCSVTLKRLAPEEISNWTSQPSTSSENETKSIPQTQKKETPKSPAKSKEVVKNKEKSPVKTKPQKASLTFSRTKYETEKKVEKIKRRMSRVVDPDSDDNEEKRAKKDSKHSKSRQSVDSKKGSSSGDSKKSHSSIDSKKKDSIDSKKDRSSIDSKKHQHSSDSKKSRHSEDSKKHRSSVDSKKAGTHRSKESKSSRVDEKKNGHDTVSKHKKIDDKKSEQVQTGNTSKQTTKETKTDQNCNEVIQTKKRSRSNSPSASDSDAPLKKNARVSPPQVPSTSILGKTTFDFPTIEDTTERLKDVFKVTKPPPRRHQSMFIDCPERFRKRQVSTDHVARDKQSEIIKKSNEIRKQIKSRTKSVGERPTLNVEDRKQKLKELAQNKQIQLQQKQEVQRKMSTSESKALGTGTVKVKYTPENRGNFLTQEIPKPSYAKTVVKKPDPPPQKSAVERFREKHVKGSSFKPQAASSPINGSKLTFYEQSNDTDDVLSNIEVQPPKLNVFNQPMASTPPVTQGFYRELSSQVENTPTPSTPTTSASLTPFPKAILDPTIFERTKGTNELKSILKPPLDNRKKGLGVSFKETLFEIKEVERYIIGRDRDEQENQPCAQRTSLKQLELMIPEEIMSWPTEWLNSAKIPEQWLKSSMTKNYDSLDDYKDILRILIRIELFSKMKSANYSNGVVSTKDWSGFLLRSKLHEGNRQRLVLDWFNQNKKNTIFKNGLLLIVKVNQTTKNALAPQQQPKDITFFGYVTAINESNLTVDIMIRDLPQNISALKCKPLLYINNEIRSMVAIDHVQETPLIRNFLDPGLNKLSTTWSNDDNSFLKINCVLDQEQRQMVNVITAECLKDRSTPNIMVLSSMAGTGKTRILIESLVNIIRCSKKDDLPCSILVCTMSNVLADQIAIKTAEHQSLHKNDKLARIGDGKEIGSAAQKLYKRIDDNLKTYDVIFTTVTHAHEIYNHIDHFDICFIDDANMVIDSELVILLQFNIKKLFLIGDIMQTQPMIHSVELKNSKYDETCFARMVEYFKDSHSEDKPILELTSQHRMSNQLTEIASRFIYKKINFCNTENQNGPQVNQPFLTIGIKADDFLNKYQHLAIIISKFEEIFSTLLYVDVGIIVADEGNKRLIESKLDLRRMDATVCTIDNITFPEKDAIILIAATKDEIENMCRYNRLNKAITRARYAVRIVGISTFFSGNLINDNLWNNLAHFGIRNYLYRQINQDDRNNNVMF